MLKYFVPEDNETNDIAVHEKIREQIKEPVNTENDKPSSREEIASVIKTINPKTSGEDRLTSETLLRVFRSVQSFLIEVCNKCLTEGSFPRQWKKSSPNCKAGERRNRDASKYVPVSLLNVVGKVLGRLIICIMCIPVLI